VAKRNAALAECDAAIEARDVAVDQATSAEIRVVSVQQAQQRRINMSCDRINELEDEIERMIVRMIS
jgi:hypothetical protein